MNIYIQPGLPGWPFLEIPNPELGQHEPQGSSDGEAMLEDMTNKYQ
jgi:hypothetical protein